MDPLRMNMVEARNEADAVQLEELMEDEFGTDYLQKFAESEFSSENVVFLRTLRSLQRCTPLDGTPARQLSREICETHVLQGGRLEVNMPPELRKKLEKWLSAAKSSDVSLPRNVRTVCSSKPAASDFPC